MNVRVTTTPRQSKADFATDQEVRWCPGCGDYAVLANLQRTLPDFGVPRERFVFISGIGCSSRFPYYMNTYGFHTIHGRAPTVATGLKVARPELSVWVVTGDGDALSIGGNHLIHMLRRNVDVNVLLFNNRIYGLTKGQYSPTSEIGKKTKSTPLGSVDAPFNPLALVLGAGASFVARSIDIDAKHLQPMLRRVHEHKGASFLEIYQNCNIFNDGAFDSLTDKSLKADNVLVLEHGRPLAFGKDLDKGLVLRDGKFEAVSLGADVSEAELAVHDETDVVRAFMLAKLAHPTPIGVFYATERPTLDSLVAGQVAAAIERKGDGDIGALLASGQTWEVK